MKSNHTKLIKLSPLLIPYILFAQTTVLDEIEIKEKKR